MVQCSYCGRENLENAVHCRECGSELHPKVDDTPGIFAENPEGKRYWNLAAGSLVISIASIIALMARGPMGGPVQCYLILLPAGIASTIGIVAAVRCSLLCKGLKQSFLMAFPALGHAYILLLLVVLSALSMGR